MPDNVTYIESQAFEGCDSLRFIRWSSNLECIGALIFYGCKSIEAIYLPPTVTYIDTWAFADCKSLRFFYIPEPITYINIGDLGSSMGVIDYWPHSTSIGRKMDTLRMKCMNGWGNDMLCCHAIKLAPALSSLLKGLQFVVKNTESIAIRKLTINKWRHCIFYAPILMLEVIASVHICNWLQKLSMNTTLKE